MLVYQRATIEFQGTDSGSNRKRPPLSSTCIALNAEVPLIFLGADRIEPQPYMPTIHLHLCIGMVPEMPVSSSLWN